MIWWINHTQMLRSSKIKAIAEWHLSMATIFKFISYHMHVAGWLRKWPKWAIRSTSASRPGAWHVRKSPDNVNIWWYQELSGKKGLEFSAVFYLKFFEHPSFGQVAHEIYPSEWKVHSSEISITIMYCWYMFLMAVATDFTHVTINLVCCCLSPVLISHKRSCWKISQSLKPIWLDVEMLVPLFLKINQCCRDACQISEQSEDSKRLSKKLRQDLCDIESAPIPVQCSANSSLIVLDK